MPTYKLTYFNIKALAEPLRLLLSYGGQEFEDVRVEKENWPALKPTFEYGQLPVLEVDGKQINQSLAIARYLGKQFNLGGSNALEDLEIDAIVDTVNDFRLKAAAVIYEQDEAIKAQKRETLNKEIVPFYLEKFEALAKKNNGHLALGKLTWADFILAGQFEAYNFMAQTDLFANFPALKSVIDNVLSLPKVKEWVAKRPKSDL